MSNTTPSRTSAMQLIIAWAFVAIPLLWGVWQTLKNALKLFR
jgi:hypothetical protein